MLFTMPFVLHLIWLDIEFTKTDLKGKIKQEITEITRNFIPVLRVRTKEQSIINLTMKFCYKYLSLELGTFRYHVFWATLIRAYRFNGDNGWIEKKHIQCHWADYWPKSKQNLLYLFILSLELFTHNKLHVVLETCLVFILCEIFMSRKF